MAGGIGPASSSSTGLITDKVYNNAVPSRIYWEQGLQRNQTVLVASIPAYDLVELNVSMGTVEYALRNDVNASCKILINNRTSEGQVSVVKIDILNSMDVYWKMNGNLVDVYIKATTGSYNYCTAVCQSSVLGVAKNKIIKLEISDNDVSQMNVAGAYYPNVFGYTNLDSLSTGVAGIVGEASNSKAGLMPSDYTIYSKGATALDFNTCKNIGRQYCSYGSINGPVGGNYYWGIFNIGYDGGWFVQIACASYSDGKMRMYRRIHYSNNAWTAWEQF